MLSPLSVIPCLGAFLLTAVISATAADSRLPEIHVPRFKATLEIDGNLNEACWKKATRIILSDPWHQTGHAFEPTEVLILCTDQALYFAFLAQDTDIRATHTDRDDRTHKDDCVEIFLARPRELLGEALGLEINALGTVADFYYRHANWLNYGWEPPDVRVSARKEMNFSSGRTVKGSGYCVEVEIPWKELLYALPEREIPDKLRANFARWDYGKNGRIFSIWSDPQLSQCSPYRLEQFGWLLFDKVSTNSMTSH